MTSITPISATDFSTLDGGNYTAISGIASTANGTIVYVSIAGIGVIKSTNSGSTWNNVFSNSINSVACSSNGTIVYAVSLGNGLYKSTNSGVNWDLVTFSPNNTLPGGAANPESPSGGVFPGYELTNIYQIACDSTGSKLIMTTNAAASIYQSTNGGSTWSFLYTQPGYSTNPNSPTMVASNSDGTVLYAALNTNTTQKNIIISKNSGVTWNNMNMFGIVGPFQTLATNSFGDFLYSVSSVSGNNQLNTFYPTHAENAVLVAGNGNTYVALASYNDGNNIIISQNNYPDSPPITITNGAVVFYSVVNKFSPGQSVSVPCFKDDSKILCFKEGREDYVKVQDIRKGDLVKTLKHGYVPVNMIGTTKLYNSGDMLRGTNKLYLCSLDKYPELTEDLVITGFHSILEDNITEKQKEETIELLGNIIITDNKYRLMACLDERTTPYLKEGVFNIWHIALDNDDYYMNYGIYANGLLVETCSKRYLKELSGMILIE
jgi:hypothetical protein